MKDLVLYDTVDVTTGVFAWAVVSNVLTKFLFEWKSAVIIDREYNFQWTWIISKMILQGFWLIWDDAKETENKGKYVNEDKNEVLIYLRNQWGRYKRIADAILNPSEIWYEDSPRINIEDWDRITGGFNKIYYWVPWCGKSYQVNNLFNKNEYKVFRTTFYPDYSNSDFVWQIVPKVDDKWNILYDFQEWPFTEALLFALQNPDKKVCLIIEEINRWNASAIFWDIFQLLDRDVNWKSQYEIDNYSIKKYINEKWDWEFDKVFIPSNLWIISTMNTSDQNVYTLDTAFQRRWRRERIKNEFEDGNSLANMLIPGSDNCTWKIFVQIINNAILHKNPAWLNWEDKQLWIYFVSKNELISSDDDNVDEHKKAFVEKVLRYIWDDVSKLDPSMWFNDIKSFDELEKAFYDKNLRVFKDIFDDLDNWEE